MPKRVPKSVINAAISAYEDGGTLASAAATVGLSVSTLRAHFNREGIEIRKPKGYRGKHSRKMEGLREHIIALYNNGHAPNEIKQQLGLDVEYIVLYGYLRKWNAIKPNADRGHGSQGAPEGTTHVKSSGYVDEKVGPAWPFFRQMFGHHGGVWVAQHRKTMADFLGRPLLSTEQVHHKDGNKQNNAVENLQLLKGAHGNGAVYVCSSCGSHDVTVDSY